MPSTKTIKQDALIALEDEARQTIESAHETMALRTERVRSLTEANEEAELGLEEVEDRLSGGDESVPALALAEAEAEVRRYAMLLKGAQGSANRAKKARTDTDSDVAEVVAALLRPSLPGVEVHATFVKPTEPVHDLPVVYVVQTEPTESRKGGVVKGKATVLYHHTLTHRNIDVRELEQEASRQRMSVKARGRLSETTDTIDVTVQGGWLPLPVIDKDPTDAEVNETVRGLANGLAARWAKESRNEGDDNVVFTDRGTYEVIHVCGTEAKGAEVVSVERDGAKRIATVDVSAQWSRRGNASGDPGVRRIDMGDAFANAVKSYEGEFLQGIGMVASAERHRSGVARLVVESSTPRGR